MGEKSRYKLLYVTDIEHPHRIYIHSLKYNRKVLVYYKDKLTFCVR